MTETASDEVDPRRTQSNCKTGLNKQAEPSSQYCEASNGETRRAFDLSRPGRLRIEQLMFLLSVSRTTFYRHLGEGLVPPPDGYDLKNRPKRRQGRPYWFTETILPLVKGKAPD